MSKNEDDFKNIRINKTTAEKLELLKVSNESYDTVINQLIKDNERMEYEKSQYLKALTNQFNFMEFIESLVNGEIERRDIDIDDNGAEDD